MCYIVIMHWTRVLDLVWDWIALIHNITTLSLVYYERISRASGDCSSFRIHNNFTSRFSCLNHFVAVERFSELFLNNFVKIEFTLLGLPKNTFVYSIHWSAGATFEFADKVFVIRQRSDDAEAVRTVRIRFHHVAQPFRSVNSTEAVGIGQEEKLFGSQILEFTGIGASVSFHIIAVSPESFSDSSVIRNVLPLGVDSV